MRRVDVLKRVRSSTTDPTEADALLREADGRFVFSRDPGADFSFRVEQAGDDDLAVGLYRIGGEWQSDGEFDRFSVSGVFSGDYRWEIDGDRDSSYAAPFLARPGHDLFGHGVDLTIVNVYIAPDLLRDVARVVFADDRVQPEFASPRPVDLRRSYRMLQSIQLAAEFLRSGTIDNPMVRASLFHELALDVLETFPLVGDHRSRPATNRSGSVIFRRATAFIDDHLSLPISVGDIARASGASRYDLDLAFRARTGGSAGRYLRVARISAARLDRRADPSLSDADLAYRWGFASTERFSRAYRSEFGEPEAPPAVRS